MANFYFDSKALAALRFSIALMYSIFKSISDGKNNPFNWGFFYFRFMSATFLCVVLLFGIVGIFSFITWLAIFFGIIQK
jgi:hypothetical protein